MNLIEYFKSVGDQNKLPYIPYVEWKKLTNSHTKEQIRCALAQYIHQYNVEFPYKEISPHVVCTTFHKLQKYNTTPYQTNYTDSKIKYKHSYNKNPLGVIEKTHKFNNISDYYQQRNRLNCSSIHQDSPVEIWNDIDKLSKMNWHFWRDGVLEGNDICASTFRSAFRLGAYTATQFKPNVAKFIYSYHNVQNVLDMSCGWGDRLAGFYATSNTALYVGCDPNPDTYAQYKQQCQDYERFLGYAATLKETADYFECIGSKTVKIWNKPAEDIDWTQYTDTFDIMFSSPPYFCTERYGSSSSKVSEQSWYRYTTFESWRDDFFFPTLRCIWNTIKQDGWMMVNIIDPNSKRGRYALCDDMVDYVGSFGDSNYIGQLLMELNKRPNTGIVSDIVGEPIWVFRKKNSSYIKHNTIESFIS